MEAVTLRNVGTYNRYKTLKPYSRPSCEFCQYCINGWNYRVAYGREKQVFVKCGFPMNIQGVYKWMVRFQKLTRNLFLALHGHNVTPSAAATVQVSHALPAVRLSCLLRGQFPRWRRSRKRLSVSSVLRCPDLWLQCSVSFVHRLEKAHHAGRNKFLVNFWTRTILLCTPCI